MSQKWVIATDIFHLCLLMVSNGYMLFYVTWSVHFRSVAQSCMTLCDLQRTTALQASLSIINFWSLLKLSVHWVSDAIQTFHPLSSLSSPAFNLSQHQGLFQWVSSHIRWPKYCSFSFSISPSKECSGLISFRISLQSKGLSRVFSNTTVQKHQFFGAQLSL